MKRFWRTSAIMATERSATATLSKGASRKGVSSDCRWMRCQEPALDHAGSIVGIRPSVHFPGVEDDELERDLDRVWEAADKGCLWIATAGTIQPGPHPPGMRIVPTVDLRGADAEMRAREFANFLEGLGSKLRKS